MPRHYGQVRGGTYLALQELFVDKDDGLPGTAYAYVKSRRNERANQARLKRLAALDADPSHVRHGTMGAYKDGCRCDKCTAVNHALKAREYRAKKDTRR